MELWFCCQSGITFGMIHHSCYYSTAYIFERSDIRNEFMKNSKADQTRQSTLVYFRTTFILISKITHTHTHIHIYTHTYTYTHTHIYI